MGLEEAQLGSHWTLIEGLVLTWAQSKAWSSLWQHSRIPGLGCYSTVYPGTASECIPVLCPVQVKLGKPIVGPERTISWSSHHGPSSVSAGIENMGPQSLVHGPPWSCAGPSVSKSDTQQEQSTTATEDYLPAMAESEN